MLRDKETTLDSNVQMIILDPDQDMSSLTLPKAIRIAYISIGEAEDRRPYWAHVQNARYLMAQNKDAEGNTRVDFRDQDWQNVLTLEEIPRLLKTPIQGLFLANLNSIEASAFINWLSRLRKSHPELLLLAEGPRELESAAPFVDGYVIDGVWTSWDSVSHRAQRLSHDATDERLKQLENAQIVSNLPVFTIEYLDAADAKTRRTVLQEG